MRSVIQDGDVRLRRGSAMDTRIALEWYRDPEVLKYSEGTSIPYTGEQVDKMYRYLMESGYLYIIEVREGETWKAIGDACLMSNSIPIVIGEKSYRSRGYGKRVLRMLINLAVELNWEEVKVKGIFSFNERSIRLFSSLGFVETGIHSNDEGVRELSFTLDLKRYRNFMK